MLGTAFEKSNLNVILTIIDNGEKSIRYINSLTEQGGTPPKIFIIDYQLPGKNGFEIISTIKSIDSLKQIPIILFTGTNPNQEIRACCQMGAVYVSKPSDFLGFMRFAELIKNFLL